MGKKREYDDDDGRTIADMSDIGRQPMWLARRPQSGERPARRMGEDPDARDGQRQARPWEDQSTLSKEERRLYILGAVKAGLLIALFFIVGLGLLILLLLFLWT